MAVNQNDLDIIMNDITQIRSDPNSMYQTFNVVLFSLKGFKRNELIVNFLEAFLEDLKRMKPLPKLSKATELNALAMNIYLQYEKSKTLPDKMSKKEIDELAKPFIKNYGKISIICDLHKDPKKFINKLILKEDEGLIGKNTPNYKKIFDESLNLIGSYGKRDGTQNFYIVVLVDKYEKVKTRPEGIISEEELDEYRNIFNLFDVNGDGVIMPNEFSELINKLGIGKTFPAIMKFVKLFSDSKLKFGIDFETFVDTIINFGNLENEDAIKRMFELYCDDFDKYTISLRGLKRIVNEVAEKNNKDTINQLYNFAVDKEVDLSYEEFKDYILKAKKDGSIKEIKF